MIDLYASDSALARATQATRRGNENSGTHIKLAQLASWLAFTRIRSNLDQLIMTNFSASEIGRAYRVSAPTLATSSSTASPSSAK